MNRVTSKIAEEIAMLFEHSHLNTRSREEEAKHHARRTAAHHTATRPFVLIARHSNTISQSLNG